MGVLVKYRFENLSEADVLLIGKAIGKLTIDEAADLHQRMQGQIHAQAKADQDNARAAFDAHIGRIIAERTPDPVPVASWQPMSTAPRDGTRFTMRDGMGWLTVCEYRVGADEEWQWTHSGDHHLTDENVKDRSWTPIIPWPIAEFPHAQPDIKEA